VNISRNYVFGSLTVVGAALFGLFIYNASTISDMMTASDEPLEVVVTADKHSTVENNSDDESHEVVPAVEVVEAEADNGIDEVSTE
jgi:hypothetical protein